MSDRECYVPGMVNIGSKEKRKRVRNGWLYLAITIIVFGFLVYFVAPRIYALLIYIPAALSAFGFLQAANSFCVYYGFKKQYSLDEETNIVDEEESIRADRKASVNITIVALSIAFTATVITYIIL